LRPGQSDRFSSIVEPFNGSMWLSTVVTVVVVGVLLFVLDVVMLDK
jgi:hypothetical protein